MADQLLKPSDVAASCQISTKTVMRAIRAGKLRASRLGSRGAYRILKSDLELWIEQQKVIAEPKTIAIDPISLTRISMLEHVTNGTLVLE